LFSSFSFFFLLPHFPTFFPIPFPFAEFRGYTNGR
jgi:hypothetical protein